MDVPLSLDVRYTSLVEPEAHRGHPAAPATSDLKEEDFMSRLARLILLIAVLAALVAPPIASAAPRDRHDSGAGAAARDLVTRLWDPVARFLGVIAGVSTVEPDGDGDLGSGSPPEGRPSSSGNGTQGDGGPTIDPDG